MSTQDDYSNPSPQNRLKNSRVRHTYGDAPKKTDEQPNRDDAWAKIHASVNSEFDPDASNADISESQAKSDAFADTNSHLTDLKPDSDRSYYGDRRYSTQRSDAYDRRRDYQDKGEYLDRTRRGVGERGAYGGSTYNAEYDADVNSMRDSSDDYQSARPGERRGRSYSSSPRANQFSTRNSYGQRPSYNRRDVYDYQGAQDDQFRDGYKRNSFRQDDVRSQSRRGSYRYGGDNDNSEFNDRSYPYQQSYRGDQRRNLNSREFNPAARNFSPGRNDRFRDSGRERSDFRNKPRRKKRGNKLEPTIGSLGKRGEPITVAELVASRIAQGQSYGQIPDEIRKEYNPSIIEELEKLSLPELVAEARRQNINSYTGERRRDLLVRILRARIESAGYLFGEGTLEILPDGFGFLRSKKARYQPSSDDVYVSPSQIRRFGLRAGLYINGQIRPPKCTERYFALLRVESINGGNPDAFVSAPVFEDLVVVRPQRLLSFDSKQSETPDLEMRALDIVAPIGFGQRALITAPSDVPSEKVSAFVSRMFKNVLENYPDVNIVALLIGKPEAEIKRIEEEFSDSRCEIAGATDQETSARHMQIAEIAFEKAKRFVEYGQDVVLVIDSLPNFVRAWRQENDSREAKIAHENANGNIALVKQLSALATNRPKKLFSLARETDNGGTLTIVALAQIESVEDKEDAFDEETLKDFTSVCNTIISLKGTESEATLDLKHCYAQDARNLLGVEDYVKYEALVSDLRNAKTAEKTERDLREQVQKVDDALDALRSFKSKK